MKRWTQKLAAVLLMAALAVGMVAFAAPQPTRLSGLEERGSWYFAAGWEYNYSGASAVTQDNGMVKITVDFSNDADKGYSKMSFSCWSDEPVTFKNVTQVAFDLYFDAAGMTQGRLRMAVNSEALNVDDYDLDLDQAETVAGTLKKLPVVMPCENAYGAAQSITFSVIGLNTDYAGDLWLDGIRFIPAGENDVYVDAKVAPATRTALSGSTAALLVNKDRADYAGTVQLADPKADAATVALYQYLKAVGQSGAALYGHMEDTVLKAGSSALSPSDTLDLTGSLAAINGLDCGGLFGGFASKYNQRHPGQWIPDTNEGNIKAAALLSNEAIDGGAIMTLSCHMPNFAFAAVKDPNAPKTYDRYDYSIADSYNLSGDCMNQILPGGAFHPQFTAFLDLIAEYAQQVKGPILFRPFHENTGSWFWWGKAFCDQETYKSVFRYTVEYLRDEKGIHNMLYLYGPGSEAATLAEYAERYPGDAFVDMVGFDTYDDSASAGPNYTFQRNFEAVVELTDQFAKEHGKLFAVTETGITNSAMKKTGNQRPEWFTEILDIITKPEYDCAYFMVWSNYDAKSNYYSPYVVYQTKEGVRHGHELMDPFLRFYNDERSIFAADQKEVLARLPEAPVRLGWDATGYFLAPNGGSRILEPVTVTARVSAGVQNVSVTAAGNGKEVPLETKQTGLDVTAVLTQEALDRLGEAADGRIRLQAGGDTLAEITAIFNIAPKPVDPHLVDDFEGYYGADAMLSTAWATNKASGCTIDLTLDQAQAQEGYSMKFSYMEVSGGYAGATINKEVDWSDRDALQFWTIPDGKRQKTVVQLQANDTCYEVYLERYDAYNARAGQPTLVTIPFAEFVQRDTPGNPKGGLPSDSAKVSSFGLWVNAVENDAFQNGSVSGTIWYDGITAVTAGLSAPAFTDAGSAAPSVPTTKGGSAVSAWALERVNAAEEAGLVPDVLAGRSLTGTITRAQFAAVAVRLYEVMGGEDAAAAGEDPFSDTDDPAVLTAYHLGLVKGMGDGRFAPADPVTREQAAQMLAAVYTKLGGTIPAAGATTFADDGAVSGWARDAVAFMSAQKIVNGVGGGRFDPKGSATCEQAVIIALGMLQKLG